MLNPIAKARTLYREARYHAYLAWFSFRWEYRIERARLGRRLPAAWAAFQAVRHAPPIPF